MASSNTSSIHYKFVNDLELKRFEFDGIHISLEELKKALSQAEGINLEFNDLTFINSDTKREYEGPQCFIPRNSTVILRRVPRMTPVRMPKFNGPKSSGAVEEKPTSLSPAYGHIKQEDFAKLSEEDRLKHVMNVSTYKYNPVNYNRKTTVFTNGNLPPDFRCHRCGVLGHTPKQCLLKK